MALLISVPLLTLGVVYGSATFSKVSLVITQNQWIFTFFRWMVLIVFFSAWPWLVRRRADLSAWTEGKTQYWLQQRAKIVFWLVIFEILVCDNAVWRFLHIF
jgi:hypothetical protein